MVCQKSCLPHIQLVKFPVMAAEFFDLVALPCECLYGAHTGDAFLRDRVQLRCLLTNRIIDIAELSLHMDRQETDHRQYRQRYKCQPRIQPEHAGQYKNGMNQRFDRKTTDKSKHRPYFIDVLLHARHQLSGIMPVEKIHGERLHMPEQILSHIISNRYPDTVPREFFCIL